MKNIRIVFIVLLFLSCNSEKAPGCFQSIGAVVQQEVTVPAFNKIVVQKLVTLIIKQGPVQKVVIETGKNLLDEVHANVVNGQLTITDDNTCNYFRSYGTTKVYITSPNITEIRNASENTISSIGVLTYPSLFLESLGDKSKYLAVGDFHLDIENQSVKIRSNGIATMLLTGSTTNLELVFDNGDPRFEGQNFKANTINFQNVSSNDMLLYPVESIKGTINSTGNVILYNKPPVIDIQELSMGKLIIK